MNGAEALIKTLVDSGVDTCFANPGTTETHLVGAIDRTDRMRPVLGLFEGVCTGAADGYARLSGKPAATLLHLGPGLANGLCHLHNGRKAHSPIINLIGNHPRSHLKYDAPLSSDIVGLAEPVSGWVRQVASPQDIARDGAEAIVAAWGPAGQVASLIIPADCSWADGVEPQLAIRLTNTHLAIDNEIERIAELCRKGATTALLVGAEGLTEPGLKAAGRIAQKTGVRLIAYTFEPRMQRGAGRVLIERIPYFPEDAAEALDGLQHMVLCGAKEPVSFFSYPTGGGTLVPEGCHLDTLAPVGGDVISCLEALADELDAKQNMPSQILSLPNMPSGALTAETASAVIANAIPEDAVVVDEGITVGFPAFSLSAGAAPHDWLFITGGGIGWAMPVAVGAAVAAPHKKILCLQGDGGAMYTIQALWTMARERLDVTTVVFSNRGYLILDIELERHGLGPAGTNAHRMMDMDDPRIDFVKMADAQGVDAHRVEDCEQLSAALQDCLKQPGPHFIEAMMS